MKGDKKLIQKLKREMAGGQELKSVEIYMIMPMEIFSSTWWFRYRLRGLEKKGILVRTEDSIYFSQVKWRLKDEKSHAYYSR